MLSERVNIPGPTGEPVPPLASGWRHRLGTAWAYATESPGRVAGAAVGIVVGFLVLRGFVPGAISKQLPPELESALADAYARCEQDFPIWPGEIRMPTCDVVRGERVGEGSLPPGAQAAGVTAVICYRVEIERLYWGEAGSQKHEMAWALRTASKVALREHGAWVLFPDEEQADAARWVEYACPGGYESSKGLVPRRS